MPNFTSVHFCADHLGLDEIAAKVRQEEVKIGPLLAISTFEHFPPSFPPTRFTWFTHENADSPAQTIDLHLCPGGVIPTSPGKVLVCIGNCFVEGELRTVAAFR